MMDGGEAQHFKSQLGEAPFREMIGALRDRDFSRLAELTRRNIVLLEPSLRATEPVAQDLALDDLVRIIRFILLVQREFRDNGEAFAGYPELAELICNGAENASSPAIRQKFLLAFGWLAYALVLSHHIRFYASLLDRLAPTLMSETWHHVTLVSRAPQNLVMMPARCGVTLKKSLDRFDTEKLPRNIKLNILRKRLIAAHALRDDDYAARNIPAALATLEAAPRDDDPDALQTILLARQLTLFPESHADALAWLHRAAESGRNPSAWLGVVDALKEIGRFEEALAMLRRGIDAQVVDESFAITHQLLQLESMQPRASARSKARSFAAFEKQLSTAMTHADITTAIEASALWRISETSYEKFAFWAQIEDQLARVPQPQASADLNGVVFLAAYSPSMPSAAMSLAPLIDLKKRGYAVLSLWSDTAVTESTGDPELDAFAGSMVSTNQPSVLGHEIHSKSYLVDWKVDWENRSISSSDINAFQPVYEKMARIQQLFFLDLDENVGARSTFARCMAEFDRTYFLASKIGDWSRKSGKPVRFVAAVSHYPPAAGFKRYCDSAHAAGGVEYVMVNAGYDIYFNNLENKTVSSLTVLNLTRNADCRASFLGTRAHFEQWMADNAHRYDDFSRSVVEWLRIDRSKPDAGDPITDRSALIDRIQRTRAAGKPVFVALGKVVYDLAVPHMGGPAHADMSDWITHTVSTIAASDGLLLVKPHPYENVVDISTRPNEFFRDLIRCDLPDNVVFLPHGAFQNYELADLVDAALVWNGTSIVEFGAQRVKCIACDDWAAKDYHVNPCTPLDRAHYEQILFDPTSIDISDDNHRRSVFLLHFMSEAVRTNYPFATCTSTNLNLQKPPELHLSELDRLVLHGDADVSRMANAFEF